MNEANTPEDHAWASFLTNMGPDSLRTFCQDTERLFRINPFLEFTTWKQTGENQFHFCGKNSSQEKPFDFELDLTVEPTGEGFIIRYAQGLKSSTTFTIEADPQGSKLTITEDYSNTSSEERETRIHEVDKSLITWANDLQQYLATWTKWSRIAPWRWYMKRIWQPLKPSGRRIVYMLLWISLAEIALIALVAGIYWAEYT